MPIQIYKPTNFKIWELVDPVTYEKRGQRAWDLLCPYAVEILQFLRSKFGGITVNNWKWAKQGQVFKYSGFRPSDCNIGAKYSQHRLGKAFDPKFHNHPAKFVRKYIKINQKKKPLNKIGAIETNISWGHFDTRPRLGNKILFFKP